LAYLGVLLSFWNDFYVVVLNMYLTIYYNRKYSFGGMDLTSNCKVIYCKFFERWNISCKWSCDCLEDFISGWCAFIWN